MENLRASIEQTVQWLRTSNLSAIEGYLIGKILQDVTLSYYGRFIPDQLGRNEHRWKSARDAWVEKIIGLGAPISLSAAIKAID